MSEYGWVPIIGGVGFIVVGLTFMLIIPPMAMRSIYTQLPTRLHQSFGRISAWLLSLGVEAAGLAVLGMGVVFLLGFIDERISRYALEAFSTFVIPYGVLYLMVAILLTAFGMLTLFVGRIVSHRRNQ